MIEEVVSVLRLGEELPPLCLSSAPTADVRKTGGNPERELERHNDASVSTAREARSTTKWSPTSARMENE